MKNPSRDIGIGNFYYHEGELIKVSGTKPFDDSVRCDEDKGFEVLFDIYKSDGSVFKDSYGNSCDIKPIKLTEKWLTKLLFEKDTTSGFSEWTNGEVTLWKEDSGFELMVNSNALTDYVHQIQNLCYELNGEVIKVKIK